MHLKKTLATALVALATLTACSDLSNFEIKVPEEFLSQSQNPTKNDNTTNTNLALQNVDYLFVNDNPNPQHVPYNRKANFGDAWTDNNGTPLGNNGCDTRNDILNRDLVDKTYGDAKECIVTTGILENDPYTGRMIEFRRGKTTSALIQIEHVVALKNAWDSGAYAWTTQERINFANDPEVLIAVDGPENQSKGDKSADKWMVPNNPDYRCTYAAKQVNIKTTYGLSVTTPEKKALKQTLANC